MTAAHGGTEQRGGRTLVPRDTATLPDFVFWVPGLVLLSGVSGTVTQEDDAEGAHMANSAPPSLFHS